MTEQLPTSTTYIEPFDRDRPVLTVLAVGIANSAREGIAAALDSQVTSARMIEEATPADALARIASDDVDCIVSGNEFPDATGLDFFREIRDTDDARPFILYPAAGTETLAAEAVNAGVDGYFPSENSSPEQHTRLAERIETVVEEQRTRSKLEETSRLLLRLTEYTNDTLWMFTDDWSETVVINSAYHDVWDRSMDDLIADPRDFLEGIHPRDREAVTDKMEILSNGETADLEYRITTDDGIRWVSVHAEPVFDAEGDIEHVAGFTRDITELKNRELSLQSLNEASTELLQAREKQEVADTVIDIVESVIGCPLAVMKGMDDDRQELVPLATTEATLERPDVDKVSELDNIPPGNVVYETFEHGELRLVEDNDELSNMAQTDTEVDSVLVVPLGEHGTLDVGIVSDRNLTDFEIDLVEILAHTATAVLKRIEHDEKLKIYRKQLEQSNESLQQFAYTASHDLQEPLRMVSSYVDLLESEYGDQLDEEATEYMEFAVDGAHRMQSMIDALLQYARVDTRAQEFQKTDPNEVIDEALDSLRLRIEETDATITTGSFPPVNSDPNQLGQVFQNLLKNAITYADETGVKPRIEVDATKEDGMVTFSVADNGPGIDEQIQGDIFEIFRRTSTHEDGTGIGLSVCRRIVNRHDGEIWVESEDRLGATFAFTVPAARPEMSENA